MSRYRPCCIVRTSDDALKIFSEHDPLIVTQGETPGPLTMNLKVHGTAAAVCFCKRCGVAYVNTHQQVFATLGSMQ